MRLQASEKTSGKYREWLVALADCSKAVVAARAEEAAAKEKVTAAETDLQLFIREAEDVLGASAPPKHRGHRRRREHAAKEEPQVMQQAVGCTAFLLSGGLLRPEAMCCPTLAAPHCCAFLALCTYLTCSVFTVLRALLHVQAPAEHSVCCVQAANGEVAAAAEAVQEGWTGHQGDEGQDANASAQFKPGIKFKLAT